jgi:hypothetical protein
VALQLTLPVLAKLTRGSHSSICYWPPRAPKRLRLRIPFGAFARIHLVMFGQVVVMHLFRDEGILGQICGNNFMVLKISPPLIVTVEQLTHLLMASAKSSS